ncbi:TetR family transcriptional regulator C-terminal domain-containing protein [Inhella sp.]|uniref:TetR family transcriptional regulator C-terminal domain-containing protein n=1 Tax=Inhella sp. TaxID=1921806 RepID=UPI0035B2565F
MSVLMPHAKPVSEVASPEPRAPRAARLAKQEQILHAAERLFGRYGLEGVAIEAIASELGLSKQNLLYYYPSKEQLYLAVLDDVMDSWLAGMARIAQHDDPATAIAEYVAAKLRFSHERPSGSAVFTREVMAGAPLYASRLAEQVQPQLQADLRQFERWAQAGLIRRVDFTHLMFLIWACTQAYADLAPQFALLLGKPALEPRDYATAQQLITDMVLGQLKPV